MLDKYASLTPEMRQIVHAANKLSHPPLHHLSSFQAKQRYEKSSQILEIPRRDVARLEDFTISTNDNYSLSCRLYASSYKELPILVFFHGGAFVVGSIASHDRLCRELSYLSNCAVISVAYRLAPEHIFPTAYEDCFKLVEQLAHHRLPHLQLDCHKIALAGDSAGATLAAAVAIEAAKNNLQLCGQALLYPGTSGQVSSRSFQHYAQGWLIDTEFINWCFQQYAPQPAMRQDWRFAPLLNDDFTNLAPTWLGLAECDPLFDDGIQYADLLRSNFIELELMVYHGVTHEFIKMGGQVPQAKQALQDLANFVKKIFQRTTI